MQSLLADLTQLIRWIYAQGWSPATSTNYSCRDVRSNKIFVSRSGIDKALFKSDDFIPMSHDGVHDPGFEDTKPSAETAIHLMLYAHTDCQVILHTHSPADTLLSRYFADAEQLTLQGYELLKGLRDLNSHEDETRVPIFANNQDIDQLAQSMQSWLLAHPSCQGLLIERHGFYCWGRDLAEAKRHLEVFQFLFQQELDWLRLKRN